LLFNPFTTGHFTAKVPGTLVVLRNGIFLHKMAEDDFQTKLAQMVDNQFCPKTFVNRLKTSAVSSAGINQIITKIFPL